MTNQANLPDKTQSRKAITQAKWRLGKCLACLGAEQWTSSDAKIACEIVSDPDMRNANFVDMEDAENARCVSKAVSSG